jgi:alkylation response protein AidB-like acyl-CoA dehydrogenase
MAHRADWMFLLVRTDPDAPKHRGISFLLVDMKTPGVSVRPIHNLTGSHEFNQVFFDNVRVPQRHLVGEENRGWYVAVTLLDFERSGIDYSAMGRRLLDELIGYVKETPSEGGTLAQDPKVRNMLAERYIENDVARLLAYEVAWMQGQGQVPNKEASMSKVFGSETLQRITTTGLDIMGPYGRLLRDDGNAPLSGRIPENWMVSFSHKIAAGTSEVQRNIVASRGLSLPRA